MNRKSILALFITLIMGCSFTFPALSALAQAQTPEKPVKQDQAQAARIAASLRIVERYKEVGEQIDSRTGKGRKPSQPLAQIKQRPEWAKEALGHSLRQLQQNKAKYGVQDADAEFHFTEAMKDGRGYKHIRLAKLQSGVEVFGGERIAHLDDQNALRSMSGRRFGGVEIDTTPILDAVQAIAAAKAALGHRGDFAKEPAAKLVILPEQIRTGDDKVEGATLTYKVDLQPANGGTVMDDRSFFVSAVEGSIVWRLNNRRHATGLGASLVSGAVTVETKEYSGEGYNLYMLEDMFRSESRVVDANDVNDNFTDFLDEDNAWGVLGDSTDRQTVAVDVHFGVAQSWDYFLNRHGHYGADGNGGKILSFVHYIDQDALDAGNTSWANASGGDNRLFFGDGGVGSGGMTFGPLVTPDIVGHEFTHCVVDATANLTYANESGAIDESLSDIFGTAVEFYTQDLNPGDPDFDANYLIGEEIVTASPDGRTYLRSLEDPTQKLHPNHYVDLYTGTADNGGVHSNSGIMNYVYYLLSEGGTHPTSNVFVPAIGRRWTEDMFYTVLVAFLTSSSNFRDVADAMVEVASVYGIDERRAVERAWFAVGVLPSLSDPLPTPDLTRSRIVFYSMLGDGLTTRLYNDGWMQWLQDYPGAFARNWTQIINMGSELFYYNGSNGMAAVGRITADGTHHTTRSFPRNYFKVGWSSITWHEGYLFFYDKRDGSAQIGQITASGYQTIRTYPAAPSATKWTHIVSVQGFLFHYNQESGTVVVGDWAYSPSPRWSQVAAFSLTPNYSHIVDGGTRSGAQTGILFYNRNNATYEVGDFDTARNFTMRTGNDRWAYNFIRLGYTDIIRVGEGLLLYNENERKARVGYLLTASECDRFQSEPFQMVKDLSEAYFPAYYTHVAANGL